MKKRIVIFWMRRDLRLEDNRALSRALMRAQNANAHVLPLFIFDQTILSRLQNKSDLRVAFIHSQLVEIDRKLRTFGSGILVQYGKPQDVFKLILDTKLGEQLFDIDAVFTNHDYEPASTVRDSEVAHMLDARGIHFESYKDQVIFERSEVVKDDGKPYTVFTPYSKKWRATLDVNKALQSEVCGRSFSQLLPWTLAMRSDFKIPTLPELGFNEVVLDKIPGLKIETALLTQYSEQRNFPAVHGTSRLGLHLRFGTVSVRKLVDVALKLNAQVWLNELIWREFFMQILWHFPHVANGAFRPEYDKIAWRDDREQFDRWCSGQTGYPIVDAGMRELNATGFMHNRVRMITASFLVKHLLIDWRWGEAYFAEKLLDFDLSANNGNWQWVAGSGCDAAPYFRVFNPELQAKKFDPKSEYVKFWVPELGTPRYPLPMVNHAEARVRALQAYKVIKN